MTYLEKRSKIMLNKVFTNSSVDVLNAIRNSASTNYQQYVPIATPDGDVIKSIGNIIMDMPELQNEFLQALINRIGRTIVTSKSWENPWAMFKKGRMPFGSTVAEYFIDLAKPFDFNPATAETNIMAMEKPSVYSSFHILNYQKYYKQTINDSELESAFLSFDGLVSFIMKLSESLITSANTDEFLVMKYMLAREILNGRIKIVTIPTVTSDNAKDITVEIKSASNKLTFQARDYNMAGVTNHSLKPNQYLILNSNFDASMDVNVLATSFNMDKAEFMGHRVLVDSFGALDTERLNALLGDDDGYEEIGSDDLELLDAVPGIIVDRDFFQIYDRKFEMRAMRNDEGLYRNAWLHVWNVFAVSPFAPAVMFQSETPAVTSISVTPAEVTSSVGQTVQFAAIVQTTGFAPQTVTWSSNNENVTISQTGLATINTGATGTITITATSTFNPAKTGTATITIAGA